MTLFTINVVHDIGPHLRTLGGRIVATLAELKTALEDLKATVVSETVQVNDKLASLEALIQSGADTTELLALVSDIKSQVSGIVPDAQPEFPTDG